MRRLARSGISALSIGDAAVALASIAQTRHAADSAGDAAVPHSAGAVAGDSRLDAEDRKVRSWFESECAVPDTMVDQILPATTDDCLAAIERRLVMGDEAAVFTEPFSQWAVEHRFAGPTPGWMRHLSSMAGPVSDPRGEELSARLDRTGIDDMADSLSGPSGAIASPWIPRPADRHAIARSLRELPVLPAVP